MRPADLANEHGMSAQAIRNYERDGILPPSTRSANGYRQYTSVHAAALRTYLALVPAIGYRAAADLMRAINDGDTPAVLTQLDAAHAQLSKDRETLTLVRGAISRLVPEAPRSTAPSLRVGDVAAQLGVHPATLRQWEAAGILTPRRDPATGQRFYTAADQRDAHLAHQLRRGGYLLRHIAAVISQIRNQSSLEQLNDTLAQWNRRLQDRGLALLHGSASISDYLRVSSPSSAPPDSR
ncbi:MerR family transcriptional regulator [Mycobacterium sp.]|uniref:MerR family transcriptional regulator n=1 Tax=Mycobacterium sp. TaxID=1785 RepID=UPI002D998E41|nr:MerR family transcriptional regulator [Mycobacterium sp.]